MRAAASDIGNLIRKFLNKRSLTSFGPKGGPSNAFIPTDASIVYRNATSLAVLRARLNVLFCLRVICDMVEVPRSRSPPAEELGVPFPPPPPPLCLSDDDLDACVQSRSLIDPPTGSLCVCSKIVGGVGILIDLFLGVFRMYVLSEPTLPYQK